MTEKRSSDFCLQNQKLFWELEKNFQENRNLKKSKNSFPGSTTSQISNQIDAVACKIDELPHISAKCNPLA